MVEGNFLQLYPSHGSPQPHALYLDIAVFFFFRISVLLLPKLYPFFPITTEYTFACQCCLRVRLLLIVTYDYLLIILPTYRIIFLIFFLCFLHLPSVRKINTWAVVRHRDQGTQPTEPGTIKPL